MISYLFPGQGAQKVGMGGELFNEFEDITRLADEVLGYSIRELCLFDNYGMLNQTLYTQPALFTVNALMYLKKIKETGIYPDYLAGHSLGEYNALLAAGVFDFKQGLQMVKKRAELMSKVSGGAMAAVIGLGQESLTEALKKSGYLGIDIANYNSTNQIVISGKAEDIQSARESIMAAGALDYKVLNVSGAFHSRYMDGVRREFEKFLDTLGFQDPEILVISNVDLTKYNQSNVKWLLGRHLISPVRWCDTVRCLMGKGEMEQIGPGSVITNLVKSIIRNSSPLELPDSQPIQKQDDEHSLPDRNDFSGQSLGSSELKSEYNLKYAYFAGGMYREIASRELVVKMGQAGMMGFLGSGGLSPAQIDQALGEVQQQLNEGQSYGVNIVFNPFDPDKERSVINLILARNVHILEAAAYTQVTPALALFRLKGLKQQKNGSPQPANHIIAKVSRASIAEQFMKPVPEAVSRLLFENGEITELEYRLSKCLPVAGDICVEADSGGHTDHGNLNVLLPSVQMIRDQICQEFDYEKKIRVGAAGGLGTPQAVAAAFLLGADFVTTGSINQCTVEARTSDCVKDMLQKVGIHDTEYAPAGDLFEMGSKVQVMRKGVFFPARANKLLELYKRYGGLEELDEKTAEQLQNKYFGKSFNEVFEDVKAYYPAADIQKAESSPKYKMTLVFKWYFGYSTRIALEGRADQRVNFQVQCGPAMGAFNEWAGKSSLENWRNRHVDQIGMQLMDEAAAFLLKRVGQLL